MEVFEDPIFQQSDRMMELEEIDFWYLNYTLFEFLPANYHQRDKNSQ